MNSYLAVSTRHSYLARTSPPISLYEESIRLLASQITPRPISTPARLSANFGSEIFEICSDLQTHRRQTSVGKENKNRKLLRIGC